MPEPDVTIRSFVRAALEQGDKERAKKLAEQLLQTKPDDIASYITLAYYYQSVDEDEKALHWLEEAIQKEPEDENVLEMIIGLSEGMYIQDKLIDVVATGQRLYPDNAIFHAQDAELKRDLQPQQAKNSLQEALRLEPENDYYLGAYALLLYQMDESDEAEKHERLSLHYNPNNSWMLLQFAYVAYQLKHFKKAQFLIDEAIRIDPHNEDVQDMYETIYPSTNGFIRSTLEVSYVIGKFIGYPATLIWKATNEQVRHRTIFILVFLLELIVLHVLLGKYLYILLGVYIVMMYIGSKVKKSVLAKVVFDDTDQTENHPLFKDDVVASHEVDDRLLLLADLHSPMKRTVESPHTENTWMQEKWPQEYSRWPRYATIVAFVLAVVLRFTLQW